MVALSHQAVDSPADLEALTPDHLLLFRPNNTMPPGIFSKDDMYCRRRWRQIQYLTSVFWKLWLSEYLSTLQERQKLIKPMRNFATGDLVLVVDEKVHSGQWPLGRIVQVHPGKDGVVRSAKIATRSTTLTRPIRSFASLNRTFTAVTVN